VKAFFTYLGVATLLVSVICLLCQYVYDGDNFYHLGHAMLYAEKGPFFRPFPWVTYSVISQHNSDMWWGFHLLLAPLAVLKDKVLILAVAPGVLMVLNLLISRLAVLRLCMSQWYGFALLPASAGFLTRMDTVRPQALSASLLVLLFAAIVSEAPALAILTSLLIGFVHPTLSYLIVIVGFCTFLQRGIAKKQWNVWLELSCLVVALTVACIRPGIADGLQLLKIQLVDLMMVRRAGEVKNFGVELDRINLGYFNRAFLSPVIVLTISLLCLLRFRDKEKKAWAAWGALGVVAISFLLSLFITRRGADQFAPFAIVAALCLFHQCKGIGKFAALVFGIHGVVVTSLFVHANLTRSSRFNATDYQKGTEWLAKNTEEGEIVGQGVWSDFGPLFFWGRHNRYLGGMDPVFQYRYNPETYWLMSLNCASRDLGKTSKYNPVKVFDKEEPISTVWPRDLKTKWLFCSSDWNAEVQDELKKDKKTKIAYKDSHVVIYEFLP
jgi:hypothetical protein